MPLSSSKNAIVYEHVFIEVALVFPKLSIVDSTNNAERRICWALNSHNKNSIPTWHIIGYAVMLKVNIVTRQ